MSAHIGGDCVKLRDQELETVRQSDGLNERRNEMKLRNTAGKNIIKRKETLRTSHM